MPGTPSVQFPALLHRYSPEVFVTCWKSVLCWPVKVIRCSPVAASVLAVKPVGVDPAR